MESNSNHRSVHHTFISSSFSFNPLPALSTLRFSRTRFKFLYLPLPSKRGVSRISACFPIRYFRRQDFTTKVKFEILLKITGLRCRLVWIFDAIEISFVEIFQVRIYWFVVDLFYISTGNQNQSIFNWKYYCSRGYLKKSVTLSLSPSFLIINLKENFNSKARSIFIST